MTDFENWLYRHQDHLVTYTFAEIKNLAVAAGFRERDVISWYVDSIFGKVA